MTSPAIEIVPTDGAAVLAAAQALAPVIAAGAAECEAQRRMTDALVAELQAAGVYGMAMPKAWGGAEADPLTQVRIIEAIAAADGAAGWCAMIGSDGGYVTSFLEEAVGRAMYPEVNAVTAFVVAPGAAAAPVDGGYSLTGRWPFASGCHNASWVALGAIVPTESGPRLTESGVPEIHVCVVPREQVEILDTWYSTGVRGSGSNNLAANGLFVPSERAFSFVPAKVVRPGPLYAWPMMFTTNMAGVPLGIARGAIDELLEIAKNKRGMDGSRLADEAWLHTLLARTDASVRSVRELVLATLGEIWACLVDGGRVSRELSARYRAAMTYTFDVCCDAVDALYRAAGSASLYIARSTLDRRLRDIHTIRQHIVVSPKTYESAGRVMLGLPVQQAMF